MRNVQCPWKSLGNHGREEGMRVEGDKNDFLVSEID